MDKRLRWLNALPAIDAERALSACCASPPWARTVAAARPYADRQALLHIGAQALAELSWPDVAEALAAHPRIGQRADGADRDAVWSRREQSQVVDSDDAVRTALREVNDAYEDRFGHLFLIFANGRSAAEILAAARSRLDNDTTTERTVVRAELTRITVLRLTRLLAE
ncbi:2-oxo-4-hydroxy-4-carboxy-5-ureidoimidazoline decarboxylase [Micromonospora sp. NPDC005710]|uniref:2-oxo-4-hydroxy-4-carboxy-5-ureidoimidazoline decarboxylase n=1 Tax=Micromonospora sp. NPDC005710 TaxID=3157051 RepID=UPI0033CB3F8A